MESINMHGSLKYHQKNLPALPGSSYFFEKKHLDIKSPPHLFILLSFKGTKRKKNYSENVLCIWVII